jgi:hypothetical protein
MLGFAILKVKFHRMEANLEVPSLTPKGEFVKETDP